MSGLTLLDPLDTRAAPARLVDLLLGEQQELTAVEKFAAWTGETPELAPARRYRDLLPTARPREGEQYAFEVDLDACTGCKACVAACHNLNGLDEGETWRSVGLLHGGETATAMIQHVTTSCHHCLEPGCLDGCPVKAYEKDPLTGIVRHLDDQCIGCQYCIFKCPYDAPKYNARLGIVRKCDMCSSRLAAGEPPACAQACPSGAIRIALVDREEVTRQSEGNLFLPGAPGPEDTLPTTIYKTSRPMPRNLLPADYYAARPEQAHLPLVAMLVLTQMSVGAFVTDQALFAWVARRHGELIASMGPMHAAAALLLGLVGIAASILHLGRPLYAFRAVLGLRTSWLSREIAAFGLFALLALAYTAAAWSGIGGLSAVRDALGLAAAVSGLLAVFCSVMVYVDTGRAFWSFPLTGAKFLLTLLLLGLPVVLLISLAAAARSQTLAAREVMELYGRALCGGIVAVACVKLLIESSIFLHLGDRRHTSLKRTAQLMAGPLDMATIKRFFVGVVGGIALPLVLASEEVLAAPHNYSPPFLGLASLLMLGLLLAGEFLERRLFFAAAVPPKMPGVPAS
jgi:Fe-S-cluster-containing dehydrogenase component/DMSO reductase anchor subunit